MKLSKKIIIFILLSVTIYSCSVKKDTFLSRNFHALTTQYNVLFNGQQAFDKGLKEIEKNHKDNFWKRLTIEPITFDEKEIQLPKFTSTNTDKTINKENKNQSSFDIAEEKARKAIETHSMEIKGRQRNPKIDDAYLLLGKGRYYTQRFVPALEAFNYVIAEYPEANLITETRIWRAKTNIRLQNEKLAIESLKLLLHREENEAELPDEIKEQAHTAMAMAYNQTDSIYKVIEHLKLATKTHKIKEQAARNTFILGQIYSELNHKDSAQLVFQKLANFKKMPYKYRINANIELAKNSITNDSLSIALIKKFKKLIKNRDNRAYLDKLYYQIGVLEENQDSISKAISYYQKSLKTPEATAYQKTYTYQRLADIYFKKTAFIKASAYYDSVLQIASDDVKNEKRIRRVKRKHKALASLNKYETILKTNDSILQVAQMPEEAQKQYFKTYIAKIKEQDKALAQQQLNAISFGSSFGGGSSLQIKKDANKWYFYSQQSKAFGEIEFQRIWGDRPLKDNWRWSSTLLTKTNSKNSINTENSIEKRYDINTYLKRIVTDKKAIDSLTFQRNDALYQLGLIYKEQFKKPSLAIKNLERLETINTDKNLNLPIQYHLYQLHLSEKDIPTANKYKQVILTEYPNTPFAQVILNPSQKLKQEEKISKLQETYKKVYYLYKETKFKEAINKITYLEPTIQGTLLAAKFQLLKALAIGKIENKETYKKAIEFVATNYANTIEGEKAKEILKKIN